MKNKFKAFAGVMLASWIVMAGCSHQEEEKEALQKEIAELEKTVSALENQSDDASKEETKEKNSSSDESAKRSGTWIYENQNQGNYFEISEENDVLQVVWTSAESGSDGRYSEFARDGHEDNKWTEVRRNGESTDSDEQTVIAFDDDELVFTYSDSTAEIPAVKLDSSLSNVDEWENVNGNWRNDSTEMAMHVEDEYLIMTSYDESDDLEVQVYFKILGTTKHDELAVYQEKVVAESIGEKIISDNPQVYRFQLEEPNTLRVDTLTFTRH